MIEIKLPGISDKDFDLLHKALKGNKAYIDNDIILYNNTDTNTKSIVLAGHNDINEDCSNDIEIEARSIDVNLKTVKKEEKENTMENNGIRKILENHNKWLQNIQGGEKANLQGADLQGINLEKANLKEANLQGADLRYANLKKTNLIGADLSGANLYGACLYNACIHKINLERANLEEVDLSKATLREANLKEANLQMANLNKIVFQNADMQGADLRGVNIWNGNLAMCNLQGVDLDGADLRDSNLWKSNLCRADLRDADLQGVDLREANLEQADLRGADLRGANLKDTKLSEKIVQVGPIGSRSDYTIYYVDRDFVHCGCWNDKNGNTLESFKERVNEEYPDGKYREEYLSAIAMFEMLKENKEKKNLKIDEDNHSSEENKLPGKSNNNFKILRKALSEQLETFKEKEKDNNCMELLNFKSYGYRNIYEGKISKFNIFDKEKQIIEKNALVINVTTKYEVGETIDNNDTIRSTHFIILDRCYKELVFDFDLLYRKINNALDLDPIHSQELNLKVNELLDKEYFINKPDRGIVILAKTEDDKNYIGIYKDDDIKLNQRPLDFAKDKLERDDIVKVECTKVADINSILNDIRTYSNYGIIYYKNITLLNTFVQYTTVDDIIFNVEIFDNHLAITTKKDSEGQNDI